MSASPINIVSIASPGQCSICHQNPAAYVLETSVTLKTFGFNGTHSIKVAFCTVCKKQLQDSLAALDAAAAPPAEPSA